jgi:II/X family phage/plasmid replication protein
MIDWLTLNCLLESFPDMTPVVEYRRSLPHILKVDPRNGAVEAVMYDDQGEVQIGGSVEWCTPVYESIRSDTHQVTIRVMGDRVQVFGSPARSMGYTHNVFGSMDIVACAQAHIRVAQDHLPFELPALDFWFPSRIDITRNYDMGGHPEVKQALVWLRQADGGRLKVNNKYAETVYWNEKSPLNSNKAYSKGSHLEYQIRKGQVEIAAQELEYAKRLLRLENKRCHEWWRRFRQTGRDWKTLTEAELFKLHSDAFEVIIGKDSIEVAQMDSVLDRLKEVIDAKTGKPISDGQALAAYRTWGLIKMVGCEEAKASMPVRTWHHHKNLLFLAGLAWADFSAGNIVPFRRKVLVLGEPVTSWDYFKRAA